MTTETAVRKNIIIVNRRGLHARAAAKFCKLATKFSSDIIVSRNDTNVPGRSLMGLLTLGASIGKDIDIICTGNDAEAALEALSELVERGFDEDDSDGS
jgi:phosphocarrier protein HPr